MLSALVFSISLICVCVSFILEGSGHQRLLASSVVQWEQIFFLKISSKECHQLPGAWSLLQENGTF